MSVAIRDGKGEFMDFKQVGSDLRTLQTNPNAQREGAGDTPTNPKPSTTTESLGNPFGGSSKKK
jgi:hypothetical protein